MAVGIDRHDTANHSAGVAEVAANLPPGAAHRVVAEAVRMAAVVAVVDHREAVGGAAHREAADQTRAVHKVVVAQRGAVHKVAAASHTLHHIIKDILFKP
jgi:hypothetical protein